CLFRVGDIGMSQINDQVPVCKMPKLVIANRGIFIIKFASSIHENMSWYGQNKLAHTGFVHCSNAVFSLNSSVIRARFSSSAHYGPKPAFPIYIWVPKFVAVVCPL